MNYLDANFIAALHFNVPGQTEAAERFVRKSSLPYLVSGLAEMEARRAFVRRTGQSRSEPWEVFMEKLETGGWLRYPVAGDFSKDTCELLGLKPGDVILLEPRVEGGTRVWVLRPQPARARSWVGCLGSRPKHITDHSLGAIRESLAAGRKAGT